MVRQARITAAGYPHHVTQRGNRRLPVFFCDDDYQLYIDLMAEFCKKHSVEIWSYCLMTNHVHLIAVPQTEDGLRRAIGEVHRRYSYAINRREGWTGHLFQGRFASYVMDEQHALAAARYIEMNPVQAKMVRKPWRYPWSSIHAYLGTQHDKLVTTKPLSDIVGMEWKDFLLQPLESAQKEAIEYHIRTGWPNGAEGFLKELERKNQRDVIPKPRGRPKKKKI